MSVPVIVTGADEAFALPMAVTLFSAAERLRQGESCEVYILDGGLSESTKGKICRSLEKAGRGVRLNFIRPRLDVLGGLPLGRFGAMTYLRLLIPESLPSEISHAIYLDSDLLVQQSLQDLWQERSDQHAIAAVPDYGGPHVSSPTALPNWQALGLPADAPYVNAGVLVMNLTWWRTRNIASQVLNHCRRYATLNRYADQDGLNAVLCCVCKVIDLRWNVPGFLEFDGVFEQMPTSWVKLHVAHQRDRMLRTAAIVHFIGNRKPWGRGLASATQRRWLAAMARSHWFDGDSVGRLRTLVPIWADYPIRNGFRILRDQVWRPLNLLAR